MDDEPTRLLLSRIEDASLNASAPTQQRWFDGWLVRCGAGKAKRARSINAVASGQLPLDDKLKRCERLYSNAGLPLVVRITPFTQPTSLDADLAARGWRRFDNSVVMWTRLESTAVSCASPDGLQWASLDGDAFAAAVGSLRNSSQDGVIAHADRLRSSPVGHRGVVLQRCGSGETVACGQVATEFEIAGLYDVHVLADMRRRGLGGRLCEQLLATASAMGAVAAYLQVEADHEPARRLYRSLGFADGYEYHYRSPPAGD